MADDIVADDEYIDDLCSIWMRRSWWIWEINDYDEDYDDDDDDEDDDIMHMTPSCMIETSFISLHDMLINN